MKQDMPMCIALNIYKLKKTTILADLEEIQCQASPSLMDDVVNIKPAASYIQEYFLVTILDWVFLGATALLQLKFRTKTTINKQLNEILTLVKIYTFPHAQPHLATQSQSLALLAIVD